MANNQIHSTPLHPIPTGAGEVQRNGRTAIPDQPRSIARVTERPPMREVYARELAWAAKHLPGEYGPFVALAIASVKRQGGKPSTGTVMAHLEALGRDAASRSRLAERRTNG